VPASAAGKAVVPDDEFSLAKVGSLGYFLLLRTWCSALSVVTPKARKIKC
jgi:hypothetical protein